MRLRNWMQRATGIVALWTSVASAQSSALSTLPAQIPRLASFGADPVTAFRDELTRRSLQYFIDNTNPRSGLTRDRARAFGPSPAKVADYQRASLAATGFGMAVLANAATRGLMAKDQALDLVRRGLNTADTVLQTRDGWFYHFVDWDSGARMDNSEVSTIDTAWFFSGALYAAAVLGDAQVQATVDKLFGAVNFTAMRTDEGARPNGLTLTLGWTPEHGFLPWQWSGFAEHLVLVLMGLGHPTDPMPAAAWCAFDRPKTTLATGEVLVGADLPLFVHLYPQLFVDFRGFPDPSGDLAHNAALATAYNTKTCNQLTKSETFSSGYWGLSASDGPDGYKAYSPSQEDGTACLGCAGAAAMFVGMPLVQQMMTWSQTNPKQALWGQYGFVDGMNVDRDWYDIDSLGITVGPLYMALANMDAATAFWPVFDEIPAIKNGLQVAAQACK